MGKFKKALKNFFSQMTTKEFALLQAVNLSKFIKSICIMIINLILLIVLLVVVGNSFPDTFNQKLILNLIYFYCFFMFFINLGKAIKWGSVFSEWGKATIYLFKGMLWMSFGLLDFSSSVSDIDNSGIVKNFSVSVIVLTFVIIVQKFALWLIKVNAFKYYNSANHAVKTNDKGEDFQEVSLDKKWQPYVLEYTKKVSSTTVFVQKADQVTGDLENMEKIREYLLVSFKMRYSDIEFEFSYPFQWEEDGSQCEESFFVNRNQLGYIALSSVSFREGDLKN